MSEAVGRRHRAVAAFVNLSPAAQLAAIIAVGGFLRIALFEHVGIWLDHGFYSYDSRLILKGQTPFVDFLGRSPLFLYGYAAVRAVVGYSPASLRAFIGVLWLLTTLPVYGLAREILDHRGGLTAAWLFAWLPFGLVYGQWSNTMSMAALLATSALYLLATRDRGACWAVAGGLLAAAFLARRSVVVLGVVVLVVLAVKVRREEYAWPDAGLRLSATIAGGLVVLATGYVLLARFNLQSAVAIAEIHAVNLFVSTGRGGWPLIGTTTPTPTNELSSGFIPVLNHLCNLCGRWTARTLAKGLLVAVSVTGLLTGVSLRYVSRRWMDKQHREYLVAAMLAVALYAVVLAAWAGFWPRVAVNIILLTFCVLAWRVEFPPARLTARPALLVTVTGLLAYAGGYLYRARALHVYYGMDLWPLLCVLAGVVAVVIWRRGDRRTRALLAVALVLGAALSLVAAYPLANVLTGNDAGWHTPDSMAAYEADIDARTDGGDVVLAETALYVAGTDADMVRDDSRATAHVYSSFQDADVPPANRLYANLTDGMRSGEISHVVEDPLIQQLIGDNATATRLYQANYCRVDAGGLYDRTNATLYRHQPTQCQTSRPTIPEKYIRHE